MIIAKKTWFLVVVLMSIGIQASEPTVKKQPLNKWTKEQLFMSREDIHNDLLNRYKCMPIYGSDNEITECLTEIPSFSLSKPREFTAQRKLYKKIGAKQDTDSFYKISIKPGQTFQDLIKKTIQTLPIEVNTNDEVEDVIITEALETVEKKQGELKKFGQALNRVYANALELLSQCYQKSNYLPKKGECKLQTEFLDDTMDYMSEVAKTHNTMDKQYKDLDYALKKRRFELEKDMITKHKLRQEAIEEDKKWDNWLLKQELGE